LEDAGFQTIESARLILEEGAVGAQASLPGGVTLTLGYDDWVVAAIDAPAPAPALPQVEVEGFLTVPGRFPLADGWSIVSEYFDGILPEELFRNSDRWTAYVSADDLGPLQVRARNPGESFQPLGLAGHSVTVKKYMINAKVPAAFRARWPIVAGERYLLWLVGHRIDERARCQTGERVVKLTCRPD
jgi:tRNA(Ile)-lysidine synthase